MAVTLLVDRPRRHHRPRSGAWNESWVGDDATSTDGPQSASSPASFVVGILFLIITPWVVRGLAAMDRGLIRGLLGADPQRPAAAAGDAARGQQDRVARRREAERTRIERDLHDGVQPRLVVAAMDLGLARETASSRVTTPRKCSALIDRAQDETKQAIAELRELVRGIQPAVLTDRGLDAALSSLAARCPVPVTVHVNLDERPPRRSSPRRTSSSPRR